MARRQAARLTPHRDRAVAALDGHIPWRVASAGFLALCIPFGIYLLQLRHLWFDAPIWDDYGAVLYDVMRQLDAPSVNDWLAGLFRQHLEHRIAIVRLVSWAFVKTVGHIDFRWIQGLGALSVFGIAALAWSEFRRRVPPMMFLGVGLLLFQWSYFEATLGATSLANLTVVLFAFACLYFAVRANGLAIALALAFAMLAIGSQASGLLALPVAAVGCLATGSRRRAALFALAALIAAVWYLWGFERPIAHPSPLYALAHPLESLRFFLMILGSIIPGIAWSTAIGVVFVAALAWSARAGMWRAHPTAALWVVFLLASAATAAIGRVGLGVVYTSRYAIYSSLAAALLLLVACAATAPWSRWRIGAALALSAGVSVAATGLSWAAAVDYSVNGHRLARAVAASPDVQVQRYFGMYFPDEARAAALLDASEARAIYEPPKVTVYPTRITTLPAIPATARVAGSFDNFAVRANTLTVGGWTDIPATVPGRALAIVSTVGSASPLRVAYDDRRDVAMATGNPVMEFGGFHLELAYPSDELARKAAESICVVASAPGHGEAVLPRKDFDCMLRH